MSTADPPPRRLGPILLSPGATPAQVFVFVLVILAGMFLHGFANLMQPVLLVDQLHVANGEQGRLIGYLTTTQHAAVLLVVGLAGALSDRIGRRWLLIMALTGFTVTLWAYPAVTAVWGLFAARFFWGASYTGMTAGGATKMMDYPDNASRGKFLSLMLIVQAIAMALFLTYFGSRIISWLKSAGLATPEAIRYGFWGISLLGVAGIAVGLFFLARDGPAAVAAASKPRPGLTRTLGGIGAVFAEARANPRFAVVMIIGAVIRTESVIMVSFLALWIVQAGRLQGIDPIEATKTAAILLSVRQISGFVTPPVFGWLADRFDRLTLLIVALGLCPSWPSA